jgi:hypothetical protein
LRAYWDLPRRADVLVLTNRAVVEVGDPEQVSRRVRAALL